MESGARPRRARGRVARVRDSAHVQAIFEGVGCRVDGCLNVRVVEEGGIRLLEVFERLLLVHGGASFVVVG